jgi:hypothetical protein
MSLPGPGDGPLGTAIANLYDMQSFIVSQGYSGSLSLGVLTFPGATGRLIAIGFALASAATGSPVVVDVRYSLDAGVTFVSATSGAGFSLPASATDVVFQTDIGVPDQAQLELVVMAVGSITPGTGLTASMKFGPF